MLAKEYKDKLVAGKIKPEEAINQIYADKKLKLPDEVNGSGAFAGLVIRPGETDQDGRYESINKVLEAQSSTGFTEISNLVADTDYPKTGNKKEVGYFFIQITKVFKGQADVSYYEKQLEIEELKFSLLQKKEQIVELNNKVKKLESSLYHRSKNKLKSILKKNN